MNAFQFLFGVNPSRKFMEEEFRRLPPVPRYEISSFQDEGLHSPPLDHTDAPRLPCIGVLFQCLRKHRWIDLSLDGQGEVSVTWILGTQASPSNTSQLFRPRHFAAHHEDAVHHRLSCMLSALGLPLAPDFHRRVIRDVVRRFCRAAARPGSRTRLVVEVELVTTHVRDEPGFFRAAQEEEEFSMVPAADKVAAEGDERCVICLEELSGCSDLTRMPCHHRFHGDCVAQWLKRSHYCPLCRFEMPT